MAVQFILGRAGTGKTWHCFESVERWVKEHGLEACVILITPRQATQIAERQLVARTAGRSMLGVRVVSPDTLVREIAPQLAESLDLMDGRGRRLLIALAIQQHADELKYFKGAQRQPHLAARIDAALAEIEQAGASLEVVRKGLGATAGAAGAKLDDLAVVQQAYEKLLSGRLDRHAMEKHVIESIRRSPLVASALVVVDGFADLTPMQRRMMVALGATARRMEITLLADLSEIDGMLFARTGQTYQRLKRELAAAKVKVEQDMVLREQHRFAAAELAQIEAGFGGGSAAREGQYQGSAVRLIEAAGDLEEVRFAAEQVRRWQIEGVRLREIGVFCRDLDGYGQTVRPIFREYGIPCFVDQKRSLSGHPLIRYIRASLRVAMDDWRRGSVMELLKCGLSPLKLDEVDRLENFALRHGIDGAGWMDTWEYLADPVDDEAEAEEPSSEDRHEIQESQLCSGLRDRIVELVRPVSGLWKRERITVAELTGALRGLITRSVQGRIAEWASLSEELSQEQKQAMDAVSDLLGAADKMLDGSQLPPREIAEMLLATMEELSIKLAPPTLDQVLVGQIDRSRSPEFSRVIMLGMNEGIFPAKASEDSIFSDAERCALEKAGVELNADSSSRAVAEQLLGYIAMTRASHELVLTRPVADEQGRKQAPSGFVTRLQMILPGLKPQRARLSENPRVAEGRRRAAGYVNRPAIDKQTASELLGDELTCSATRLELFAQCPFRHFMERSLRLQEREVAEVSSLDLGNAFHDVLEKLGRKMIAEKFDWAGEKVEKELNGLIEETAKELRGQVLLSTARNSYLRDVIRQMVMKLRRDEALLSASGHKVQATELSFGEEDSELQGLEIVTPQGRRVRLRGRIDRIDCSGDGKSYLVFDYKSSAKRLSLCELEQGIALQLLIYWLVMKENGKHVDAALYQQLMRPMKSGKDFVEDDPTKVSCKPRGMIRFEAAGRLDPNIDPNVGGGSNLYGFSIRKKDLQIGNENSSDAYGEADLEAMEQFVRAKIAELADRVFDGDIRISPFQIGTRSACPYCPYRAVCRFDPPGDNFHVIPPAKRTDVLDRINPARAQSQEAQEPKPAKKGEKTHV